MMRISNFFKRLKQNEQGVAMVEFAVSLPFFVGVGMYSVEISNMAITNMEVSQIALNLSDNASRMGQTDGGIVTPTITEHEVIAALVASFIQGRNLDIVNNGRLILSSLELDGKNNQQIRWQRCLGIRDVDSIYGPEGTNGTTDPSFIGMGQPGREVLATTGTAVMFVEVEYEYQPLFGSLFVEDRVFRQEAAFNIRDDRNLSAGLAPSTTPLTAGASAIC